MKKLVLLLFLISPLIGKCQRFNRSYYDLENHSALADGFDVITAVNNGYIIAGRSHENNGFYPCIIRLDDCGDTIWHKTYFNLDSGVTYFQKLIYSSDGNLLCVSPASPTSSAPSYHFQLTKIDTSGSLIWNSIIYDQNNIHLSDFIETNTSDILVCGSVPGFRYESIIFKLDFVGNEIWQRQYVGKEEAQRATIKRNGNYAFAMKQNSPPYTYTTIMSTDTAGNILSNFAANNSSDACNIAGLYEMNDGSFIVAGSQGEVLFNPIKTDLFVCRVTPPYGTLIWKVVAGNRNQYEVATDAVMLTDSTVVIASRESTFTYWDGLALTVSKNGNLIRKKSYIPLHNPLFEGDFLGIDKTPDGGCIFTGNAHKQQPPQVRGIWVVKTDSLGNDNFLCPSIILADDQIHTDDAVTIFPNPFTEQFNLEFKSIDENGSIIVRNSIGQIVNTSNGIVKSQIKINLENETSGIYFVQILFNGQSISKKILKQNR